jgi:hypothetical protein
MAFPADPLPVLVEMKVGSTWTDITSDVLVRDGIDISRGKQSEDGQAPPQTCRLTLNNRAGKYSPRNPLSTYYGQIGRNTGLRVAVQVDPVFDAYTSAQGTGDLSFTHTPVGTPTGVCVFVWQYNTAANQVASVTYGGVAMENKILGLFVFGAVNVVGYMYFLNRDIPTGPQTVVVDTTAVIMRQASAITITGGTHCEFENSVNAYSDATPSANPSFSILTTKRSLILGSLLSDLDDGSTISPGTGYTQLGEHDLGTETVSATRASVGALAPSNWAVLWNAASAHWGIMAVAVRAVHYRFWGEASSFPPKWDTSTNDAYVPLEASGILRRLSQGTDPPDSGLRNFILASAGLFRYWPLSGAKGTKYSLDIGGVFATGSQFVSRVPGGTGNFVYGTDMGSEFLGTGVAFFNSNDGPMEGSVSSPYANWALDFVFSTIESTGGMGNFTVRCYDYNSAQWSLNFNAGIAQVSFDDGVLGPIGFSPTGVLPQLQDLGPHHVRLEVRANGANTDWTLSIDGVAVDTGTQAASNVYGLMAFQFYMARAAGQERINLAHVAVWSDPTVTWPSATLASQAAFGYAGEEVGARILRVATLAAFPLTSIGDMTDTISMGEQHSEGSLVVIRDAESTDLGILTESKDALSLLYRTRGSLYNQTVKATIDAAALELSPPFEPIDDDQATRNIITAVRRNGDSFRLEDTTSRLSSLDPPLGVGPYKDEITFNVETDAQLQGMAAWSLNLATVDEARYPYITVERANRAVVANATLSTALLTVDIGDRIAVANADVARIYDDISLLVLGYSERMGAYEHTITFNCAPESPYNVAVYGSAVGSGPDRYDAAGSSLTAGVTSTATSLSVTTTAGNAPWTTTVAEFPFDIQVAGERMTVTNITSATSPQTFTVTRSVNGVVKAQAAAAAVRLWNTPRYAL